MRWPFVMLVSCAAILGASGPLLAGPIPCDNSVSTECMGAPTCQTNGGCRGEPINEGQPCTQEATSGGCMTVAFCKHGVCTGTVPAEDGHECNLEALAKCYSPGHCKSIPGVPLSFCMFGTPKVCPLPSDPCKESACNPQNGECFEGDKCFTFYGCEVCNAGTCMPVNLGGLCANPEGDFNDCTTDDHCALLTTGAISELDPMANAHLPAGLAAAIVDAQQVGQSRALCQGVPGGGGGPTATPTTGTTPTPTVAPSGCVGDCSGDGTVTVNELILMVNVALGNAQPSVCLPGDPDSSGDITINEIVAAVNRALNGCG